MPIFYHYKKRNHDTLKQFLRMEKLELRLRLSKEDPYDKLSELAIFNKQKARQQEAKGVAKAVTKIEELLRRAESNEFAQALRETRDLSDLEFESALRRIFMEVEFHPEALINKHPAFMQIINKAWLEYKLVRLMNPEMKADEARKLFKLLRRQLLLQEKMRGVDLQNNLYDKVVFYKNKRQEHLRELG